MTSTTDLRHWIGFHLVPGVGPVRLRMLIETFGSAEEAWTASEQALRATGLPADTVQRIVSYRKEVDLDAELDKLDRHGVRAVTREDDDYPRRLREIDAAPYILYIKGTLAPEDDLAIGMVGTRRATPYGRDMTRHIASDLATAGVVVVSGLALGIDTAAHRAALDAGGRTIAICGNGLDIVYPPRNRRLAEEIIENGALLSEFPLGTQPEASNFPARNRIISGVSRGVVIVEAPQRSGALITASFAANQGREVYAVPGSALSKTSAGCHELIRSGATLVTGADDILEDLNMQSAQSAVQTRMVLPDSDQERRLYELIGAEPRHIDEICLESGLSIQETNGLLVAMELKGLIRQSGTQFYVRA